MIIIKTANGDRFINESEAQSVTHNKEYGYVVITFKDGHSENAFQVESMYYTNKQDVEIRDNGLLMAAVASDVEYYKEMNESACRYLEQVADRRNQMEQMVVEMFENPDSSPEYRKRIVDEIKEEWKNRPGTIKSELDEYRTMPYYHKLRQDSHEKGEEIQKEFVRMSAKIKELEELKTRVAQLEPKEAPDRWWPDNVDRAPISVIICRIGSMGYDQGYEVRLEKIFESNDIKTVGDLLRIGRRDFKKYRSVGGGSITRIDEALKDLYDIQGW